jgi:hypothetical protein
MDKAVTRKELDLQGSKHGWLVAACQYRYGHDGFIDGAARFATYRPLPEYRKTGLQWTPERTPSPRVVPSVSEIGNRFAWTMEVFCVSSALFVEGLGEVSRG